jgi:cell division protein ZapA
VKIKVYGQTYNIKSSSSEISPQELADYVDGKMNELASGSAKTSTLDLAILTALNLAQELFETRRALDEYMTDDEGRQEELENRLQTLVKKLQTCLP